MGRGERPWSWRGIADRPPSIANVAAGLNIYGVAVDPFNNDVYATTFGSSGGAVDVIMENTPGATAQMGPVGGGPMGIAVDGGGEAFVTNSFDGTVSALNTPAPGTVGGGSVFATIPVGSDPQGVAVDNVSHLVYVANHNDGTVSVIDQGFNDPAGPTVIATIPVGAGPFGVAITPSVQDSGGFIVTPGTVYVTNETSGTVSVISEATNTVTDTIPVGKSPMGIAVSPDTGHVYVANSGSNTVSVLAPPSSAGSVTASGTVNQVVSLSGLTGTITFPAASAGSTATATGAEAYAATTNDPTGYTLTLGAAGSGLTSGSDVIPNTDLTVTETGSSPGPHTFGASAGAMLTLAQTTAPSTDSYGEDWALAIPSTAPAATYSESFVYLVLGN